MPFTFSTGSTPSASWIFTSNPTTIMCLTQPKRHSQNRNFHTLTIGDTAAGLLANRKGPLIAAPPAKTVGDRNLLGLHGHRLRSF